MKLPFLICFLLGSLVVFQPVVNRMILEHRGLGFAVFLNGTVFFFTACILFLFVFSSSERMPEVLRWKASGPFRWWFLLPGLMGFLLVFIMPLMIRVLGAFPTVVAMLLGQIATSFLWDALLEGEPLSLARVAGLMLASVGAYLSFKPS